MTYACDACGTDHEGYDADSLGGRLRCLRAQAQALGAGHLVDQVDAASADYAERRDQQLRSEGLIP